jgi:hypothetical protein
MTLLLSNFTRIRSIICVTWNDCLIARRLDLVTAAATTQAALQIIRGLVYDFEKLFPQISPMEAFHLEYLRQSRDIIRTEPKGKPTDGTVKFPILQLPQTMTNMSCMTTYVLV